MAGYGRVLLVATLAALAGAVTSLWLEPRGLYRLAGSAAGQQLLQAATQARAPTPPPGVRPARLGEPMPAMTLSDLDGRPVQIPQAWRGRPTLVNLWASWCAPCLKEMPDLQAFATHQGQTGVQVVGIALDDTEAVRAFLAAHAITYLVLLDTPGPADAGVRLGNTAGVLPYSVLIAADGRLLKTRIGPFADLAEIHAWAAPASSHPQDR